MSDVQTLGSLVKRELPLSAAEGLSVIKAYLQIRYIK